MDSSPSDSAPVLSRFRFMTARALLELPRFERCQDLPDDIWCDPARLWTVVFISHRWEQVDEPDPQGRKLGALKRFFLEVERLTTALSTCDAGDEGAERRIALVPTLRQQGTLQAAHLVVRALWSAPKELPESELETVAFLDKVGIWFDFSCLPQAPRSGTEQREFEEAMLHIGALLSDTRVMVLALRTAGDDYLMRGWCLAEAALARASERVDSPLVLRMDALGQRFSVLGEMADRALARWEDPGFTEAAMTVLATAITPTLVHQIAVRESETPEFSLAFSDAQQVVQKFMASATATLLCELAGGGVVDLSRMLPRLMDAHGLICTQAGDRIMVALLVLASTLSREATGHLAIWREALHRFMQGRSLIVTGTSPSRFREE